MPLVNSSTISSTSVFSLATSPNSSISSLNSTTELITTKAITTVLPVTIESVTTVDFTQNDSILAIFILFNICFTCCLSMYVAYNREVFCFSSQRPTRRKFKEEDFELEEDDEVEPV